MIKLAAAIAFVSSVALASPVFACSGFSMPIMRKPPKGADSKKPKATEPGHPKAVPSETKDKDQKPASAATAKDASTNPAKVSRK
jgi:hypothetical protein